MLHCIVYLNLKQIRIYKVAKYDCRLAVYVFHFLSSKNFNFLFMFNVNHEYIKN